MENNVVKFGIIDRTNGSTISIEIEINGIRFKRLSDKWHRYPPVWNDVDSHFGSVDLQSKEKESELEAIFQAHLSPSTKLFLL